MLKWIHRTNTGGSMKKLNLSQFIFALEYHLSKSPITAEAQYLKSLITENEKGYVGFSGELFTDGENIYSKDEYDHKSWLHVCDIDWTKYEN